MYHFLYQCNRVTSKDLVPLVSIYYSQNVVEFMEHFKTIAIFTYPSEYVVLELLLQQHEILYVFQNETMISVLPFHSNAIGGIRLKVHQDDIEQAKDILKGLDDKTSLHIV